MKVLLCSSDRRSHPECPTEVPIELLHEDWAQREHGQTLKRLNERGGLSPTELICNIKRVPWSDIRGLQQNDAIKELNKILSENNTHKP